MNQGQREKVLKDFILEFLPNSKNNRKYRTNELEFVSDTLSKVFSKIFNINIEGNEIVNAFDDLNYRIHFQKDNSMGEEVILTKARIVKGRIIPISGYEENNSSLVHFQIRGPHIKDLSRFLKKLPPNTNEDKIEKNKILEERIKRFVLKYKNLN
ncbi:hypothetical protein JYB64_16580 [Algoriphagus aestuarii]|nr:hypothetical protein [Algoriphagus aestuarii]